MKQWSEDSENSSRQTVEGNQTWKTTNSVVHFLLFLMSSNFQPKLKGNPNPGTAHQGQTERSNTIFSPVRVWIRWVRGTVYGMEKAEEIPGSFSFYLSLPGLPPGNPVLLLAAAPEGILKSPRKGNPLYQRTSGLRNVIKLQGKTD